VRIRILHLVDTLGVGGLQNGLANLLGLLDTARFEHVICTMRSGGQGATQPLPAGRAEIVPLSKAEAKARFQTQAIARKIRAIKPDIVHTRNWGTAEGMLAAWWVEGCARIHSEHGIDWDTTKGEPWRRVALRRLAFEAAHRVLSVSHELKELHARRTGFPGRKIEVIHNGVDSARFAPDAAARERIRRELAIADEEFCVGCVGNLIPVKDHLTILNAMDRLAPLRRGWRLLLVGDGPELRQLKSFADAHEGWKSQVIFLGRRADVPAVLNAMDAYVLCSLTEGISNSLLEAMATGLPVLATHTGGNPEVVVDAESGRLFPVGDAAGLAERLVELMDRTELRAQLGAAALRRVRAEFSMDSMVRRYEEIYQSPCSYEPAPMSAPARL
jgi:sugar transferase (PEP-CTERM/EpsH1 system associated)